MEGRASPALEIGGTGGRGAGACGRAGPPVSRMRRRAKGSVRRQMRQRCGRRDSTPSRDRSRLAGSGASAGSNRDLQGERATAGGSKGAAEPPLASPPCYTEGKLAHDHETVVSQLPRRPSRARSNASSSPVSRTARATAARSVEHRLPLPVPLRDPSSSILDDPATRRFPESPPDRPATASGLSRRRRPPHALMFYGDSGWVYHEHAILGAGQWTRSHESHTPSCRA